MSRNSSQKRVTRPSDVPGRGERARRLLGAGRKFAPDRDAVAELIAERAGVEASPADALTAEQTQEK
jgi:hypothetical protein